MIEFLLFMLLCAIGLTSRDICMGLEAIAKAIEDKK